MAIKSLRTINRLHKLTAATTTEVAMSDFRSIEEVREYVLKMAADFVLFSDSLRSLKELFLKHNVKNRISKTPYQLRNPLVKAAGPTLLEGPDDFEFNSEKYKEDKQKYGKGAATRHKRFIGVLDKKPDKLKVNIGPYDIDAISKGTLQTGQWEENVDALNFVLSLIRDKFRGDKLAAPLLALVTKLQKSIRSKLDEKYEFMEKVGKKIAPPVFTRTIQGIIQALDGDYKGTLYKKSASKLYLVAIPKPNTENPKVKKFDMKFMWYYRMDGLKDDAGFTDEKVYLVFTGIVDTDELNMVMSVVFLNSFVAPAKTPVGRLIFTNLTAGLAKAQILIGQNLHVQELETAPLPDTDVGIEKTIKDSTYANKISSISVKGERITVELNQSVASQKEADFICHGINIALNDAFKVLTKSTSTNLRTKLPVKQNGYYVMEFFMAIPPLLGEKGERLTLDGLDQLRRALPFEEHQLRDIVRTLNFR